jgi:hypothetical protein
LKINATAKRLPGTLSPKSRRVKSLPPSQIKVSQKTNSSAFTIVIGAVYPRQKGCEPHCLAIWQEDFPTRVLVIKLAKPLAPNPRVSIRKIIKFASS